MHFCQISSANKSLYKNDQRPWSIVKRFGQILEYLDACTNVKSPNEDFLATVLMSGAYIGVLSKVRMLYPLAAVMA